MIADLIQFVVNAIHVVGFAVSTGIPAVRCAAATSPREKVQLTSRRGYGLVRPRAMGIVFSRLGFTAPATVLTKYTSPQSILLWSGDEFGYEVEHGKVVDALKIKYRMAQERGLPDFDARAEFEQ